MKCPQTCRLGPAKAIPFHYLGCLTHPPPPPPTKNTIIQEGMNEDSCFGHNFQILAMLFIDLPNNANFIC